MYFFFAHYANRRFFKCIFKQTTTDSVNIMIPLLLSFSLSLDPSSGLLPWGLQSNYLYRFLSFWCVPHNQQYLWQRNLKLTFHIFKSVISQLSRLWRHWHSFEVHNTLKTHGTRFVIGQYGGKRSVNRSWLNNSKINLKERHDHYRKPYVCIGVGIPQLFYCIYKNFVLSCAITMKFNIK